MIETIHITGTPCFNNSRLSTFMYFKAQTFHDCVKSVDTAIKLGTYIKGNNKASGKMCAPAKTAAVAAPAPQTCNGPRNNANGAAIPSAKAKI